MAVPRRLDCPQTPGAAARRPLAVDLFAGAGGFALGFEQAGFDVVTAVEYDTVHAAAHAFNFPRTKVVCADASTLTLDQLTHAVETGATSHGHTTSKVDVVFGGPPCQGFSAGGKRLVSDARNLLIFDFLRLTLALRPRYFVLENVPPLKNFPDADCPQEKLLDRFLAEFEAAGYSCLEPQVINASRYGVPQDRRRLIVIGADTDEALPSYPAMVVSPVPKRPSDSPRPWEQGGKKCNDALPKGPTVWDALRDLPDPETFDALVESDEVSLEPNEIAALEEMATPYVRRLRGLDMDPSDFSYPREWDRKLLTASRRTTHAPATAARFHTTRPGHCETTSRFYRLHPDGLCSTLRAGTGYERGSFMAPRPIHPKAPRVVTVREAARLHSFPDWFRFHYSKWHGFRQIGNSLPPLLGRAIAAELRIAVGASVGLPTEAVTLGDSRLLKMATYEAARHLAADTAAIPTHRLRHRRKPKTGPRSKPTLAA